MKIKYWHDGKWTHKGVKQGDQKPDTFTVEQDGYTLKLSWTDVTDYSRFRKLILEPYIKDLEKNKI